MPKTSGSPQNFHRKRRAPVPHREQLIRHKYPPREIVPIQSVPDLILGQHIRDRLHDLLVLDRLIQLRQTGLAHWFLPDSTRDLGQLDVTWDDDCQEVRLSEVEIRCPDAQAQEGGQGVLR